MRLPDAEDIWWARLDRAMAERFGDATYRRFVSEWLAIRCQVAADGQAERAARAEARLLDEFAERCG